MDFYQALNDQLMGEYQDVVTYINLSKNAKGGDAHILRDIAREEYVHAKHLKSMLQEAGRLQDFSELESQAAKALEGI